MVKDGTAFGFVMFKISGPGVWKKIINTCVYTHTHAHQEAKCISFKSWVSTLPNNLRGEAQALISSQSCNCFTTSLVNASFHLPFKPMNIFY